MMIFLTVCGGGHWGRNKRNEDVFCSTRFRENALAPAPTHSTCDLTDRGAGGGERVSSEVDQSER